MGIFIIWVSVIVVAASVPIMLMLTHQKRAGEAHPRERLMGECHCEMCNKARKGLND